MVIEKSVAIAASALALIGLFWAVVFVYVVAGHGDNLTRSMAIGQRAINASNFIAAVGTLATAIVAVVALNGWRHQARSNLRVQFLDDLTDAIHGYIDSLASAIRMTELVRMSIFLESSDDAIGDQLATGAIAYIQKNGDREGKRYLEYLKESSPHLTKIRSLVAKGQVLGIRDYTECQKLCNALISHHERMLRLCWMIARGGNAHWGNIEKQRLLDMLDTIIPAAIEKRLSEQSVAYIKYVRACYADELDIEYAE